MSSSAALLDHDFGSESEDDNFNPAPADDSDNDAAGDDSRAPDGAETKKDGPSRANGNPEQLDDEDEDGENGK